MKNDRCEAVVERICKSIRSIPFEDGRHRVCIGDAIMSPWANDGEVANIRDAIRRVAEGLCDGPEPGQEIWEGECPVCGTSLNVQYGDEPGQIGIVYSRKD